jgi:hypothetical protein
MFPDVVDQEWDGSADDLGVEQNQMLIRNLLALLAMIAVMAFGPGAEAWELSVNPNGLASGGNASDTIILESTVELFGSETFDSWSWSIDCTGCQITGWTYNYVPAAPPFVPPGHVYWFNQSFELPTTPTFGGNTLSGIGSSTLATPPTAAGSLSVIGWVTVHLSSSQYARIDPSIHAGQGFSSGGVYDSGGVTKGLQFGHIPEPGTGLLVGLGLAGLGSLRRPARAR